MSTDSARNRSAPSAVRLVSRRASLGAGLAAVGSGLGLRRARAQGLPPVPNKSTPLAHYTGDPICPLYQYAYINGIWYYYAYQINTSMGSCMMESGPYCMQSATQITNLACNSSSSYCVPSQYVMHARTASGLTKFPETSHTRFHVFGKSSPEATGLAAPLAAGFSPPEAVGESKKLDQQDYWINPMGANPIAVRVFLILLTPPEPTPQDCRPPLLMGFGQEVAGITPTQTLEHDQHTGGKCYYRVYRRWDNVYFHVLTHQKV